MSTTVVTKIHRLENDVLEFCSTESNEYPKEVRCYNYQGNSLDLLKALDGGTIRLKGEALHSDKIARACRRAATHYYNIVWKIFGDMPDYSKGLWSSIGWLENGKEKFIKDHTKDESKFEMQYVIQQAKIRDTVLSNWELMETATRTAYSIFCEVSGLKENEFAKNGK